jgi:hypothetical protein
MLYTVYQTDNLVNGKIYVGIHVTENPNDSYLGSGNLLKAAVLKYGSDSFKKKVLFIFDNVGEMAAKEAEIVTQEFIERDDTYNLILGGAQGDCWNRKRKEIVFDSKEMAQRGREGNLAFCERLKTSSQLREMYRKMNSRLFKRLHAEGVLRPYNWSGKKHSEATRRKLSELKKGVYDGEKNPSFGTCWVVRDGTERKIPKTDLSTHLDEGWVPGRTVRLKTAETRKKLSIAMQGKKHSEDSRQKIRESLLRYHRSD